MAFDRLYQNSYCLPGYLHDFQIAKIYPNGTVEICNRCHKKMFFKDHNRIYLSYHLRLALQPSHKLFTHEYASR